MKLDSQSFRVIEGKKFFIHKWPTRVKSFYASKDEYQAILHDHIARLDKLQQLLYASNQKAVLLIFQAMDAAGKDGAIRHVMSGINPQGCQVVSFKHPSASELLHDFLWRTTGALPERGKIGIFNRSYYEEVLIVRVHPEILEAENVKSDDPEKFWDRRFRSIRDFERHLNVNGTCIIKIFLHLSKEEQRKRFLSRIEEPAKNWKFSQNDMSERGYWDDYMRAYQSCIESTSTTHAPWYVVPADDKLNARLIVSQIILDTLDGLNMSYPAVNPARKRQLQAIKRQLLDEAG